MTAPSLVCGHAECVTGFPCKRKPGEIYGIDIPAMTDDALIRLRGTAFTKIRSWTTFDGSQAENELINLFDRLDIEAGRRRYSSLLDEKE